MAVSDSFGAGSSAEPAEVLTLCVVGTVVAGAVISGATGLLNGAVRWLVSHGVLVDGRHDPVWTIPGAGGVGLDWPRLLVAAGAIVLLLLWTGSAVVRRIRRRQAEES